MKKTVQYILFTVLLSTITYAQTATAPSVGDGTSEDPYQIATLENLYWLTQNSSEWVTGKYFIQTADIDASASSGWDVIDHDNDTGTPNEAQGFSPIGNSSTNFTGNYNGQNHTISNITINRSGQYGVGLFGYLFIGANISNIRLTDVNISGKGRVGGLAGASQDNSMEMETGIKTISGCEVIGGSVTGNGDYIGGLVGFASTTIINNSGATAIVITNSANSAYAGGLLGSIVTEREINPSSISGCYATGNVTAGASGYSGGFIGSVSVYTTITNCYSSGNSTTSGDYSGGFIGRNDGTISNCYSTGSASGSQFVGAFIGGVTFGSISNCYSIGTASGTTNVAAFIGLNNGSVTNGFWDKQTSGSSTGIGGGTLTGATGNTTADMKKTSTFAGFDFDGTAGGTDFYWVRVDNKNGGYPYLWYQTFTNSIILTDGSSFTPTIAPLTTNQTIGRFALSSAAEGSTCNSVWIKLNGTRTGASNFKLWQSDDNSFNSGTDLQIGSTVAADPGDGQNIWFTGLNQQLTVSDKYYFLTADIASDASGSIQPILSTDKELMLGFGVLSSSISDNALSSSASPLPVELTSFTANVSAKTVMLNWQTATEVNNYGFEILRRFTPQNDSHSEQSEESKIGFVEGHGNSNSPKEYSFIDESLQNGKYLYRLKQIDFDGKFEYSEMVELEVNIIPTEFALFQNYPNPFNPTTTIKYNLPVDSKVIMEIYNVLGERVMSLINQEIKAGFNEVNFNASNLSSGIYIYTISAGEFNQVKKMMLLK